MALVLVSHCSDRTITTKPNYLAFGVVLDVQPGNGVSHTNGKTQREDHIMNHRSTDLHLRMTIIKLLALLLCLPRLSSKVEAGIEQYLHSRLQPPTYKCGS
ncbi:hypothetical protein HBI40_166490 [Parastagonospora nodorum]|nr:hypothetical protein HBI62_022860 [Parastagonospora nodorum]KAH6090967.1 hypothetical protein HBI65_164660 [Parastagonospora nodorum]KAH6165768.1 hypothetical protein HBI63_031860 [Parastagonospora nodorum]KAH6171294.1 hypothetical protein HBI61_183100 [Parastagonospora nodorum]KAH6262212.1 hypothetical protein HBI41_131300 [Parastagonospora nodorum]